MILIPKVYNNNGVETVQISINNNYTKIINYTDQDWCWQKQEIRSMISSNNTSRLLVRLRNRRWEVRMHSHGMNFKEGRCWRVKNVDPEGANVNLSHNDEGSWIHRCWKSCISSYRIRDSWIKDDSVAPRPSWPIQVCVRIMAVICGNPEEDTK